MLGWLLNWGLGWFQQRGWSQQMESMEGTAKQWQKIGRFGKTFRERGASKVYRRGLFKLVSGDHEKKGRWKVGEERKKGMMSPPAFILIISHSMATLHFNVGFLNGKVCSLVFPCDLSKSAGCHETGAPEQGLGLSWESEDGLHAEAGPNCPSRRMAAGNLWYGHSDPPLLLQQHPVPSKSHPACLCPF